jgi:hypothetical protein
MNFGLNENLLHPLPTIWNILHLAMKTHYLPSLEFRFEVIIPKKEFKSIDFNFFLYKNSCPIADPSSNNKEIIHAKITFAFLFDSRSDLCASQS